MLYLHLRNRRNSDSVVGVYSVRYALCFVAFYLLTFTFHLMFLLIAFLFALPAQAQQPAYHTGSFELLYGIDSLNAIIEMDVRKLQRDRDPDVWLPANLELFQGKKSVFKQDIEVQARGNARRKICDFPPIKIRFSGDPALPDSLKDAQVIKIVSACNHEVISEQLVLKECLMYKLYNVLTEESFRVKLATIQFKERGRKRIFTGSYAFFLENESALAKRLNGQMFRPTVLSPRGVDTLSFDRICLFEFMIGNTDWSIYNLHNIRALKDEDAQKVITVPYDFDYAGAVEAPYAVPQKGTNIQTVQERYYLGVCREEAMTRRIFDLFLHKKADIMAVCDQFTDLSKSERSKVHNYLLTFFEVLEDPKQTRKQILEHCDNLKKN